MYVTRHNWELTLKKCKVCPLHMLQSWAILHFLSFLFDLALVLCVLRTKVVLQPPNKPPFFYWSFNPNSCFYICDGTKKMQLQSGLRVGNMLDVASSDTQRNAAAGPLSCWCPSEVRGAAADPRRLLSNHKAKEKQPVTLQHVRHVYTPPRVSSW